MIITCHHCGKQSEKSTGHVNRAIKAGLQLYCNRTCSGLGRRDKRTKEQKAADKRLYDIEYRRNNKNLLKTKKAAYFHKTYDPVKAAVERKARMPYHVEYCRQPEYRAKKREYDLDRRAKQNAGEFWESYKIMLELEKEVYARMSWYEIHLENGQLGKSQKRKREYGRSYSN